MSRHIRKNRRRNRWRRLTDAQRAERLEAWLAMQERWPW